MAGRSQNDANDPKATWTATNGNALDAGFCPVAAATASANIGVQGQGEKQIQQLGVYALNPQPEPPLGSKKATKTKKTKSKNTKTKKPGKGSPANAAPKNG